MPHRWAKHQGIDFQFSYHGHLWLCRPLTDDARELLEGNTGPDTIWWAGAVVVEPRYVPGLVEDLQCDGWNVRRTA